MGSIPINPAGIASAGSYLAPQTASAIRLCERPKEGLKSLPMQFTFNQKPGWLVSFGAGNAPMSQICALYVDCTNSEFDCTIYFPDSGFSARINAQGTRMIPVITSAPENSLPNFYVLLDSNGALTNDVVNVIALNQYIPDFESNELSNVLTYGYGPFFTPTPGFVTSQAFTLNTSDYSNPHAIIDNKQWYISAMQGTYNGQASIAGNQEFIIQLFDFSTLFFQCNVLLGGNDAQPTIGEMFSLSGLNYESSGKGALGIQLFEGGGPNIGFLNISINIFGGILVN